MRMKTRAALTFAFVGSFLATGLLYWQIPYSKASLPNSIIGFGLLMVAVLAAISRIVSAARLWPTSLVVGASVPSAVLARVIFDTFADPTSHNLWPFEIILSAGPGFFAALMGALAGGLIAPRTDA